MASAATRPSSPRTSTTVSSARTNQETAVGETRARPPDLLSGDSGARARDPTAIYEHYQDLGGENSRSSTVKYPKKLDEYELIEQTVDGWVAVNETLAAPRREARIA